MNLLENENKQLKSRIFALEANNDQLQNEVYQLRAQIKQIETSRLQHQKHGASPVVDNANSKLDTFEANNLIGTKFEDEVFEMLNKRFCHELNTGKAKLLRNLKFKTKPSAQIDILFLHQSGIYIIECKYWSGYIIGKYGWDRWFKIKCNSSLGAPIDTSTTPPILSHIRNPISQAKDQANELINYLDVKFRDEGYQCQRIIVFGDYSNMAFIDMKRLKGSDTQLHIGNKVDMLRLIQQRQTNMTKTEEISLAKINKIKAYLKDEQAISFNKLKIF